jgi:phenylpropionate dioxygenase-like ring-hydroxylating dioxygenase large terminal subunit
VIRNQWYIVLESHEVKPGKPLGVLRMGERLVFWRTSEGKVVCMKSQCPHLGAQLSQGKLAGDRLKCPFHGFEYGADGACQYVPAVGKNGKFPHALEVVTYPTHEEHGYIYIWWGEPRPDIKPPKFYDDIGKGFSYMRFRQQWNAHYSRMVENQLDVMHLPFVHYNTIGAGGKTVVDGPLVKLEDNVLKLWVYNRLDDGTLPRKPDEIPEPGRPPFLILILPNLWENRISDDLRILVAFVPVDDDHSIMYGRYYQRVVQVPILREIFNLFGVWGSLFIANQDRQVVNHQLPKQSALKKMGEVLLPGDRAILTFRTWRHQRKVEAGQIEDE